MSLFYSFDKCIHYNQCFYNAMYYFTVCLFFFFFFFFFFFVFLGPHQTGTANQSSKPELASGDLTGQPLSCPSLRASGLDPLGRGQQPPAELWRTGCPLHLL